MIDLHAHILPGVDDGPVDLEGAIDHARAAVQGGTTTMATTSHVDHSFGLDPASFAGWRATVQAALDDAGVPLRLIPGGELGLTRFPDLSPDQLPLITLGGGGTVLLEPPFSPAGTLLENAVYRLQSQGFDVLLAHPERSPDFATRLDELLELTGRGVRLQLTASSLSGAFGKTAQELAVELLRRGAVHVIASDGHGATSRSPDIAKHLDAAAKLLPEVSEQRDYWTVAAPRAILDGTPVPDPPPVKGPGRFRIGRRR